MLSAGDVEAKPRRGIPVSAVSECQGSDQSSLYRHGTDCGLSSSVLCLVSGKFAFVCLFPSALNLPLIQHGGPLEVGSLGNLQHLLMALWVFCVGMRSYLIDAGTNVMCLAAV